MKKQIIFSVALMMLAISTMAQDGITMHFMRLNPYSTYTNPSAFIQYKGYIGVPFVSNINMALTNSGLHYNNILKADPETGQITTFDLNNTVAHMHENGNLLNSNFACNIIDFGFRVKNWNISLSYRIRSDEYVTYSKDLFGFLVNGNLSYAGDNNPADIGMKMHFTAYQEIGVGLRVEITPNLAIGFKPKFLLGIANVKSNNISGQIYTDPSTYMMRVIYEADFKQAAVASGFFSDNFSIVDVYTNLSKNLGAAIDLGATYRINDNIGVSASILDLGFITWKSNSKHYTSTIDSVGIFYQDGAFVYNGLSVEDIDRISQTPDGYSKEFAKYFPTNTTDLDHYTQALAGRFIVEGYYNLGQYHRFSALFQGRIINNQFLPSFTVAWNGNFLNIFDLCVNYTIAKHSFDNLGVGIGLNLGVFHIYALTDNIISICGMKQMLNHTNTNLQVGIVFDWGKLEESKLGGFNKNKQGVTK